MVLRFETLAMMRLLRRRRGADVALRLVRPRHVHQITVPRDVVHGEVSLRTPYASVRLGQNDCPLTLVH